MFRNLDVPYTEVPVIHYKPTAGQKADSRYKMESIKNAYGTSM